MVVCDFCGTSPPGQDSPAEESKRSTPEEVPLTWVVSVENGKRLAYCEPCSRKHLRSIESKLDWEWW